MNTPKLRFHGLSRPLKSVTLGELLSFNNGINASKDSYGHGRKFINVLDILNNTFITYGKIKGSVSVPHHIEENNKVEYGDVLFLRSSETREDVGKSSVYLDKSDYALFGGFVIRGKKIGEYNPYYLKLNLESDSIRNQIGAKSGGSTRFNVSQGILSSVLINIPEIEEQNKIADFFSLLDCRIEKQQAKVESLQEQKKGLLQKIFNQGIFFDKNDPWEEYKLGELFEERSERGKPDFPLLAVTISNGVTDRSEMKNDNSSEDKTNYKVVFQGDIAYNSMRMWQGASGYSKYTGIVSPAYTVLKPKKSVHSPFFSYLFKTEFMIYNFKKYSQGLTSDTWNLKYPLLKEIKVMIPSYPLQIKIADYLSLFDQKIEKEHQKLEALQEQKKGFMQKMFI